MIEEQDYEKLEKYFNRIYKRLDDCNMEMDSVNAKLSNDAIQFAKINTKLNALLYGVGAVVTALIGYFIKLALGG